VEEKVKELLMALGFGSDESEVRYQVINITTAAVQAANSLTEASVQPDRDYNRIVGVAFFQQADGGIPENYNVGFRTTRKQWIDDININAWNANTGVSPRLKYYPQNIPYGSGDICYARIVLNGTASATAVIGQMVLILKRDLTELPK
jgi:hypothetical protein